MSGQRIWQRGRAWQDQILHLRSRGAAYPLSGETAVHRARPAADRASGSAHEGLGDVRSALRRVAKRAFRTLGYDISRIDPDRSLGEFLRSIFQHYQINCVVDVGANDGQYARFLRELGYRGQIVSFEPVASVFERLAACAAADARWDVHRLALGNEDGCREIHVAGNSPWSSFHRPLLSNMPDHYPGERVTTGRERVTVGRLDDIFTRVVERIPEPRAYLRARHAGMGSAGPSGGGALARARARPPDRDLAEASVRGCAGLLRIDRDRSPRGLRDRRAVPSLQVPWDCAHRARLHRRAGVIVNRDGDRRVIAEGAAAGAHLRPHPHPRPAR